MFKIHRPQQNEGALKKSIQKLFDHKKDIGTRLKHLKNVIDNSTPSEVQSIFEKHYSHIYFIFYENFLLAESNLRLRGFHRAQREELDSILAVFEQILINLPDLVHRRWQYHSIDTIIKKLLHTQNSIKVRREGLHFFLLWLRALRENAQPQTILVYACLIPGFPPPLFNDGRPYSLEWLVNMPINEEYGVHPSEITSLVPPLSGEKHPGDLTKYFLDALLEYMVVKSQLLNWKDKEKSAVESFSFLWDLFKQHYLPHAFEDFSYETSIYKCDLTLPEPRPSIAYVVNASDTGSLEPQIEVSSTYSMLATRVSIIKWAVAFTTSMEKKETSVFRPNSAVHAIQRQVLKQLLEFTGSQNSNDSETSESRSNTLTNAAVASGAQLPEHEPPASNTSTLTEKEPSISSLSSLDDKLQSSTAADEDIVRQVLYSTRDNINIIHELFRQAFMLPLTEVATMRRVVKVYQQWIQQEEVPVFMKTPIPLDESLEKVHTDDNSLRNTSYMRGQLRSILDDANSARVRAGPETTYQLFITNSAHVFLVQPPLNAPKLVQLQVDVCKRVLNLYRHMVMNITLSDVTWSQLLRILLHITRIMLQDIDDPSDDLVKQQSVSGRLAGPVFQTLIVSWIKANLYVHVSRELWDELVDVLSSLCHWEDLITEWSKNMETMTRVLSRNVYQIDLSDLPLDRLTEQKKKRKAGMKNERSSNSRFSAQRSFSRGWSQDSMSAIDNRILSIEQPSRSASLSFRNSSEEKNSDEDKPRLSQSLSVDSARRRSHTVPNASAVNENSTASSKESVNNQAMDFYLASDSNDSTLKRHLSASDVSDINGTSATSIGRHSQSEDIEASSNQESPTANTGLRVAWQHPTHQVHNYQCGSGGDTSECTSLSVHSIEDGDEFDALVSERLNSDSQDRDKRSDDLWPNEATSLHSHDSASLDTDWNRLVEPAVDKKQNNEARGTSTPQSTNNNLTSSDGKNNLGDEKTLPLFQAFTDDYSPPFDHQNSYEISYSPPSTLPPLPPFSQSPPAIPARKALPPSTTVNLCDLHFLTPTSESCDSNFEVGGFEKASLLHGLDSPSNTEVFPDLPSAPPQNARSAHPNLELFNFNAPGEWNAMQTADHSVVESTSSYAPTPPYHLHQNESSKRDSSSARLLDESSPNVSSDYDPGSGKDESHLTGDTSLVSPSSYSGEMTSTEDTRLLKIEAIARKAPDNDKDDVLSTSNDDILLQPLNSPRPGSQTSSKCVDAPDHSQKDGKIHGSIMSGGKQSGWYPDVAAALWRRLLGVLGDVNDIEDPFIHGLVFQYLFDLWRTLYKMRQNIGIVNDNLAPPDNQELVPPLQIMSPWAFKAVLNLPDTHKDGRLRAFQLLCNSAIQREHDIPLEMEHLAQFYFVLHLNLHCHDQDIVNKIIESCSHFFPYCLPSSNLLLLDFIYACLAVAASGDLKAPRVQAQTILGSTLCYPNIYKDLPVLDPNQSNPEINNCNNVKDYIVEALLTSSKKEPAAAARCVALSSTGLWLYEELTSSQQRHSRVKEAINVLLVSLKFSNRTVASVACSHLHLLTQCSNELLRCMPDMPPRIIEVMSLTISALLNTAEAKNSEPGRQLIVSLLLCVLDWCMTVPVDLLTDTYGVQSEKRLIRTVFKALQTAAYGKPGHSAKHSYSLADLKSTDFDPNLPLETVLESSGSFTRNKPGVPRSNTVPLGTDNAVSLAAHTVLNHLVNHLGHFPLARGSSVFSSIVSEHHDIDEAPDDLSPSLFNSPSLQFLIYNDTCLLSVVEIPAEKSQAENRTPRLTSSNRCVRFIVRGASGKYTWDASVLHGPSNISQSTTPVTCHPVSTSDNEIGHAAKKACGAYYDYAEKEKLTKRLIEETDLPHHEKPLKENSADKLEQLLQHLGHSSPECQLTRGFPLNIPSTPPTCLSVDLQNKAAQCLLNHHQSLGNNYNKNAHVLTWKSLPVQPYPTSTSRMPFHHARLLLAELNFLSRDNRNRVNLLKKNERLLRELKNLDSRNCRETHKVAVFYIAEGQEDKVSILSNTGGSKAFEDFVAGLGWEVDLSCHCGFRGKLQSDGSNGKTTPYYATSTLEVIYHVATRFPSDETSRNVKIRHLGNDEVHIVWSEHHRDYRRGIIPTEFGDVLIVIYPIRHGLHRVQIMKKPDIPYFGPLFDGAVVNARVLPVLVRETAINAGRAKRSLINLYQPFYEERTRYLRQIIDQFKDEQTFEDYSSNLFSPAPVVKKSSSSGPISSSLYPDIAASAPKISSSSSTDAFNSNNNSSSGGSSSRFGNNKKSQAPPPPPARLGPSLSAAANYPSSDLHSFRHQLATPSSSLHFPSDSSLGSVLSGLSSVSMQSNSTDSSHAPSNDTKSSRYSLFRKPTHVRPSFRNSTHSQFSIAEESFLTMAQFPTPPQSPPSEFPPTSEN